MSKEMLRCPECGKNFGTEETFREHVKLEHSKTVQARSEGRIRLKRLKGLRNRYLNKSLLLGFILGFMIASAGFSGYMYWNSLDHRASGTVTVVTCENCTYDRFRTATDRIFNADYEEVKYDSDRGQQLIERYDLNYIPGFIFEKKVEKAEDFYKIKNVLVEFDDSYVAPDRGIRVAQRMSSGFELQ